MSWLLVAIIAAMVVGFSYAIYGTLSKKDKRMPQLVVGAATLQISSGMKSPRASCFASIKNEDKIVWSDPSLQAQFFNQAGTQIDAHYETHHFNLFPFLSASARVSGPLNASTEDYATCTISVLNVD
jgi:hypothetical protein